MAADPQPEGRAEPGQAVEQPPHVHVPLFSGLSGRVLPWRPGQIILIQLLKMIMVPGNPWPLIPQIMDDGRGTPGLQIRFLPDFPLGSAHGTKGGIPEIAVIGKIIVFHRKGLYSSF